MHLIITGATGLVGSGALQYALATQAITKVSILSRRPVPQAEGHQKAEVIIHKDFEEFPSEILEKLKGADGCVWALGVSAQDVNKEDYKKITYDYPVAAANAFTGLSDPFKFVYVSGEGATTTPGFATGNWAKVKGQAEEALKELGKTKPSLKPFSVRPGGVDPTFHKEIHNFMPMNARIKFYGYILPVFRTTWPGMVSPTKDLGRVLCELALGDGKPLEGKGVSGEGRTLNNVGMRRLAGL